MSGNDHQRIWLFGFLPRDQMIKTFIEEDPIHIEKKWLTGPELELKICKN